MIKKILLIKKKKNLTLVNPFQTKKILKKEKKNEKKVWCEFNSLLLKYK